VKVRRWRDEEVGQRVGTFPLLTNATSSIARQSTVRQDPALVNKAISKATEIAVTVVSVGDT